MATILTSAKAGAFYAFGVFTAGIGLGIARNIFLSPLVNDRWAVTVELPIILALAWLLCGRTLKTIAVSNKTLDRILMGCVAFILLISAELMLWHLLLQGSTFEFFSRYRELAELIGLTGQLMFAVFPLLKN